VQVDELERARAAGVSRVLPWEPPRAEVVAASEGSNADDEHDPEGATIAFEREQLTALLHQARATVTALDDAIARRAAGDYGRCERCGRPIGEERLAARPHTTLCIDCARG
jgi:DnaK suppressor protein